MYLNMNARAEVGIRKIVYDTHMLSENPNQVWPLVRSGSGLFAHSV